MHPDELENNKYNINSLYESVTNIGSECDGSIISTKADQNFVNKLNKEMKESKNNVNASNKFISSASVNSSKNNVSKTNSIYSKLILFNDIKDDESKDTSGLNKCIEIIYSLNIEFSVICIISIIIYIMVVIFLKYSKKDNLIQEYDGRWRYQCPLEHADLVANLIELLLLLFLIIKVIKIWVYIFVFKCVKYIGYSSIIWISIGPLAN
eukprot:jgi/Orpsp1_1/1192452/evm.model.d7180000093395.1